MSALAERPLVKSAEVPPVSRGERRQHKEGSYLVGMAIALVFHGCLAVFWPRSMKPDHPPEFGVEAGDASVEISLVAALPAEDVTPPAEQPPDPTPPPSLEPQPAPEPAPPPPEKPAEMTLPETPPKPVDPPPKHEPAPKPHPAKPPAKAPSTNAAPRHAVGDGRSAIPGNDATTAHAASGARSAKPGYLRNPHPAYPEEARAAKQQGVVSLRVKVDASGHVVSVHVASSSGFPILDERARSTVADKWAFKPATAGGVAIPSEVVIPIRFTLDR